MGRLSPASTANVAECSTPNAKHQRTNASLALLPCQEANDQLGDALDVAKRRILKLEDARHEAEARVELQEVGCTAARAATLSHALSLSAVHVSHALAQACCLVTLLLTHATAVE